MSISRKQFLKNAALLGAGSALLNQNLFAKDPADNFICDVACSFDLNNPYPGITNFVTLDDSDPLNPKSVKYGKPNTAYVDINYENCSLSVVTYHSPICDINNFNDNLKYYVYYPDLPASTYQNCALPAFIIGHPEVFLIVLV